MKTIKSIKATTNYILIELSDNSKFKISDDDYFNNKFFANMEVDDDILLKLENFSNYHSAYLRALERIKYQDRSIFEIKNTINNEFNLKISEVNQIIDKLLYYGFLDDKRYTKERIQMYHNKNFGYNKIIEKLKQVKIDDSLINKYLLFDADLEEEKIKNIFEKNLKTIRNKSYNQTINTLRNKFLYQGFKNESINNVLSETIIEYNEEDEILLIEKEINKSLRRYNNKYNGLILKNRLYNQLRNRGFKNDLINTKLNEMEFENE